MAKSKSNFVLPAGNRNTDGSYNNLSNNANLWSSFQYDASNAWRRNLNYTHTDVNRNNNNKANGFSVRCVREWISTQGNNSS
ncbi:MAG: FISUMP domain-containing protein [Candidatus Pacebacteria bacterium]|nr:FISUMP domain-containing protein [Candidatus Paceibacterota bacterium]